MLLCDLVSFALTMADPCKIAVKWGTVVPEKGEYVLTKDPILGFWRQFAVTLSQPCDDSSQGALVEVSESSV